MERLTIKIYGHRIKDAGGDDPAAHRAYQRRPCTGTLWRIRSGCRLCKTLWCHRRGGDEYKGPTKRKRSENNKSRDGKQTAYPDKRA
jgi:hypothetical protein